MQGVDTRGGNAPSWLFSFVDLAFLLLIAMTQLAEDTPRPPDLGELVVPSIDREAAASLPNQAADLWQLRIHPPADDRPPFELVHRLGDQELETLRGELAEVQARLAVLKRSEGRKPLLAPHRDSRSQDLLDAVSALEQLWPGTRRAAVAPRMAQR